VLFLCVFSLFCLIIAWLADSVPRVFCRLSSGINYSKTPCLDPRNGSAGWNGDESCTSYIDKQCSCFSWFVVSRVYTRLHCKSRLHRHHTSRPISWSFRGVGPAKRPCPVVSFWWFVRWLFLRRRCPIHRGVGMSFSCCLWYLWWNDQPNQSIFIAFSTSNKKIVFKYPLTPPHILSSS